jgi:hypothetical protein
MLDARWVKPKGVEPASPPALFGSTVAALHHVVRTSARAPLRYRATSGQLMLITRSESNIQRTCQ